MAAAHGSDHGSTEHGKMDITSQKAMFDGFIKTTEWSCVMLAMLLGLTVFAFAMGLGWWTGLIVWVLIGVAAGFLMGLGGAWWATLIGSTVLLAIGGAITMGIQAIV
jgi:Bacterial aa3 type cytochrome c oxidase subunit IV